MAKWFPQWINQQFTDDDGKPLANGWVEVFITGTSTHADTYNYNDQPNANPIPLNSAGRCQLKVSDTTVIDIVIYDEDMQQVDSVEGISVPLSSGSEGTLDHTELINRDSADQHPQSSITGLVDELADKVSKSETIRQYLNGSLTTYTSSGLAEFNPNSLKTSYTVDGLSTSIASYAKEDINDGHPEIILNYRGGENTVILSDTDLTINSMSVLDELSDKVSKTTSTTQKIVSKLEIEKDGDLTEYTQQGVNYDISPDTTNPLTEGQSRWNAVDHTLDLGLGNGVVLQAGQEMPFSSKNVDGTNFLNGEVGYIYGASGQRISMKKPTASDNTALKAMFMATQDVANNNTGFFNAIGRVRGLNTLGFSEGATVYLDTVSGAITATPPAKPNYQARMGIVENVHGTEGRIFFHPNTVPKLGDLSDCDSSAAVHGDFVTKGSDGVFKVNVFYDDWRWGAYARIAGGNAPAYSNINSTGIYSWEFTNGKELFYNDMQIPHDYKEGTNIIPHIHFVPSTTEVYTGTWTFEYIDWLSVANGSSLQTKKTITALFNSSMTAFQMQSLDFSSVIFGTNRKISSIIHGKLSLSLTAGTSLFICGFDGHYQKDRFGSNNINTK